MAAKKHVSLEQKPWKPPTLAKSVDDHKREQRILQEVSESRYAQDDPFEIILRNKSPYTTTLRKYALQSASTSLKESFDYLDSYGTNITVYRLDVTNRQLESLYAFRAVPKSESETMPNAY